MSFSSNDSRLDMFIYYTFVDFFQKLKMNFQLFYLNKE